jgi:hypothetical protein
MDQLDISLFNPNLPSKVDSNQYIKVDQPFKASSNQIIKVDQPFKVRPTDLPSSIAIELNAFAQQWEVTVES